MKKVFYIFAAVAVVAMFSSCGGVNKKAKKYVKKAEKCVEKDLRQDYKWTNEDDHRTYDKCVEDLEVMRAEIGVKYVNKNDKQKDFNTKCEEVITNTKVNKDKLENLVDKFYVKGN
jgi:hypothetical protein